MDLNFPVFATGVRILRASNDVGPLFLGPGFTRIEEQIWLTECIYLADYFKLIKKKKKQNEMSFLITW
jgi:hypothetical protein